MFAQLQHNRRSASDFPVKNIKKLSLTSKIIMALNPIESGEFIVKNAKYLEVKDFGIKNLANQVKIIC